MNSTLQQLKTSHCSGYRPRKPRTGPNPGDFFVSGTELKVPEVDRTQACNFMVEQLNNQLPQEENACEEDSVLNLEDFYYFSFCRMFTFGLAIRLVYLLLLYSIIEAYELQNYIVQIEHFKIMVFKTIIYDNHGAYPS
jgi:hypothetical protein